MASGLRGSNPWIISTWSSSSSRITRAAVRRRTTGSSVLMATTPGAGSAPDPRAQASAIAIRQAGAGWVSNSIVCHHAERRRVRLLVARSRCIRWNAGTSRVSCSACTSAAASIRRLTRVVTGAATYGAVAATARSSATLRTTSRGRAESGRNSRCPRREVSNQLPSRTVPDTPTAPSTVPRATSWCRT